LSLLDPTKTPNLTKIILRYVLLKCCCH